LGLPGILIYCVYADGIQNIANLPLASIFVCSFINIIKCSALVDLINDLFIFESIVGVDGAIGLFGHHFGFFEGHEFGIGVFMASDGVAYVELVIDFYDTVHCCSP